MKTALEVGTALQSAREDSKIRMIDLVERTGLTAVTLRHVLEGKTDARISTVVAIAKEVGLELVLLPKEVADSLAAADPQHVAIESLVERALGAQGSRKK